MGPTLVIAVAALAWAVTGWAQSLPGSPYREEQASAIRGLSAREIEDLREGRGMGLARAADLNGYPGPRHLLDAAAAGQLHLTPEQLVAVRRLFGDMSGDARRLGELILVEEQALERAFRTRAIDEADLTARLARLATLQSALRDTHLRTHLRARALLADHQLERYDQLRGHVSRPGEDGGGSPEQGHPPH